MVEENLTALQTLSLLKKKYSFPNTEIALRILLTISGTSAGAERSFSKLKIIKNYLRNSLSQYKLTNLVLIAIENDIAD
jgi:Trp operon repressor